MFPKALLLTGRPRIFAVLRLQTLAELQNAIADLSFCNFLIAFMAVGRYLLSSVSEAEKESPKARNTQITSSPPHNEMEKRRLNLQLSLACVAQKEKSYMPATITSSPIPAGTFCNSLLAVNTKLCGLLWKME